MASSKSIKELPIYSDPSSQRSVWVSLERKQEPSSLEAAVTTVRQATCDFLSQFKHQKEEAGKLYESTSRTLTEQLEYVRAETNLIPKVVFISLSGLSGLLIGFRRSSFRKFIYSAALGTGAAALCFPKEAKDVSGRVYGSTKDQAYQFYREYIYPEDTAGRKVPSVEERVRLQGDAKDKVLKLKSGEIDATKSSKKIEGDLGQASDADKDMYTTRSK